MEAYRQSKERGAVCSQSPEPEFPPSVWQLSTHAHILIFIYIQILHNIMWYISILPLQMLSEVRKRRVRLLFFVLNLTCEETKPYLCHVSPILFWSHLQMNYMFLKRCVENRPFAPIQQQWLDSIVARVSPKFKEGPETQKLLQELCKEVSDDFHNVIVKHTGIDNYLCMYVYAVRVDVQ